MTTYVVFAPSPNSSPPFQFQPTLDGSAYTATVTWNLYGQRWYLNLFDLSGNRLLTVPMVGSPPATATFNGISLVAGLFSSTVIYRPSTGNIEISP